ncbi:Periplasmic trehalase precursor [Terricaulis silvestris]|uniref:Periplasmic trehalase n=1 Tax=Terricaulis silvestris TaxID=2686094 RepID=A0A6I6MKH4_9CAUL|nr:Periplasmic trehalase precursor [Terricaulis silvestris]
MSIRTEPDDELEHAPPSQRFADIFASIHSAAGPAIDTKAFADAETAHSPDLVLADYRSRAGETLADFLSRWFVFPHHGHSAPACPTGASMLARINALWPALTRHTPVVAAHSSLLPMPGRYIVPGGIFRECYYWDTYFTIVGVDDLDLRRECVDNIASMIDRHGYMPNGNRTYYLSRSQPPTFYAAVAALDEAAPERAFAHYLPQLVREHSFWMDGAHTLSAGQTHRRVVALSDGALLNRYWDDRPLPRDEAYRRDLDLCAAIAHREPEELHREIRAGCETGWDFSSRWFADATSIATITTTSIAPIDLNSLLFGLERAIETGARHRGDTMLAEAFRERAEARKSAIERYLWNEELGCFDDYDCRNGHLRHRLTAACAFPLFTGLAAPAHAERSIATITAHLLAAGGVVTSLRVTGEQWDAPNGWAPLQWVVIEGLRRCGAEALAASIAERWLRLVAQVYGHTGKMLEKYDVVASEPGGGGEYPLQDGFGWTNGVTAALIRRFPELAHIGDTVFSGLARTSG